jgi:hypothetical protein
VPEPSLIGWETPAPSKSVENFALQRGSAPPDRRGQLISLQMTERIVIEIFV